MKESEETPRYEAEHHSKGFLKKAAKEAGMKRMAHKGHKSMKEMRKAK